MSDCNEYDSSTKSLFYIRGSNSDGSFWFVCSMPSNEDGDQLQLTNNKEAAQWNADDLAAQNPTYKYEVVEVSVA